MKLKFLYFFLLISLLSCRSSGHKVKEEPLKFDPVGSWRLVPISGNAGFLGMQNYWTGIMEITKAENSNLNVNVIVSINSISQGNGITNKARSDFSYTGGESKTSVDEIYIANAERIIQSYSYEGTSNSMENWREEDFIANNNQQQPLFGRTGRVHVKFLNENRAKIKLSSMFTNNIIFHKIEDPPPEKNKKKSYAKVKGAVFSIIPMQKEINFQGANVDKKIQKGSRIIIVRDKKVIAKGVLLKAYSNFGKVKIDSGLNNINPRDVVYGF